MFSATRCPATASAAGLFWACSPRTRNSRPEGDSISRSSTAMRPATSVPVTTSPAPERVKTRSTARRGDPRAGRCAPAEACSAARRSSIPSPVTAETGIIGAAANGVPASNARTAAETSGTRSPARSALVSATTPWSIPSSDRICQCSRVCGLMPSGSATTSSAVSMPLAPASIVWTNRSCPGTSIKPNASV